LESRNGYISPERKHYDGISRPGLVPISQIELSRGWIRYDERPRALPGGRAARFRCTWRILKRKPLADSLLLVEPVDVKRHIAILKGLYGRRVVLLCQPLVAVQDQVSKKLYSETVGHG